MKWSTVSALLFAQLLGTASAHPEQSHDEIAAEARKRAAFLASLENPDTSHCHPELNDNGHAERTIRRRADMVEALRRERNLHHKPMLNERDVISVLGKDHRSSKGINMNTPISEIFASNRSCVLSPEVVTGPFYVTGSMIRQNLTESQKGVPLHLDIMVLDYKTCKPVTDQWVDIWSANSTGVYGNIQSTSNGNGNDKKNLNNTMLRGYQLTDKDGVVQFNTVVPGHYPIRANHVHVMVHIGATKLANNTIQGTTGTLSHNGQFYLDQSLLDQIEKTAPYNTNKQAWTKNAQDFVISAGAGNNDDPVINYVMLGSSLSDGIYGWITIGVDTGAKRTFTPATWWGESGGIINPNGPGPFGKREDVEELVQ